MNIQILVHSKSGNSLSVASTLKKAIETTNPTITLTHVKANNENEMDSNRITITPIPDCSATDLIVLGGPVHGFAASAAVMKTINTLGKLNGKKVVLFTTEFFPLDAMGGKRAISMMEKEITAQGGQVTHKEIIHWHNFNKQNKIDRLISDVKSLM